MFFFVPLQEERKKQRPPKLVSQRSYIAPSSGALPAARARSGVYNKFPNPNLRASDDISTKISNDNTAEIDDWHDGEKDKHGKQRRIRKIKVHIHMHIHIHEHVHMNMHTYIYSYIHIHIHIHTFMHTCIHTHTQRAKPSGID